MDYNKQPTIMSTESSSSNNVVQKTTAVPADTPLTNDKPQQRHVPESTDDARQWFQTLSTDQLMDTLTIQDDRLWQVIVQTTTAAATTNHAPNDNDHHGKDDGNSSGGGRRPASPRQENGRRTNDQLNWWEMDVAMTTVEQLWGSGDDNDKTLTIDNRSVPAVSAAATTTTTTSTTTITSKRDETITPGDTTASDNVDDHHKKEQPDAYRIRGPSQDDGSKSSVTASNLFKDGNATNDDTTPSITSPTTSSTTTTTANSIPTATTTSSAQTGSKGDAVNSDSPQDVDVVNSKNDDENKTGTTTGSGSSNDVTIATTTTATANGKKSSSSSSSETTDHPAQAFMERLVVGIASSSSSGNSEQHPTSAADNNATATTTKPTKSVVGATDGATSTSTKTDTTQQQHFVSFNRSEVTSAPRQEMLSMLDRTKASGSATSTMAGGDHHAESASTDDKFLASSALTAEQLTHSILGSFWDFLKNYRATRGVQNSSSGSSSSSTTTEPPMSGETVDFMPLYLLILLQFEYSAYRSYHMQTDSGEKDETESTQIAISNGTSSGDEAAHVVVPLERVMKKILESSDDELKKHKASLSLLSFVDDTPESPPTTNGADVASTTLPTTSAQLDTAKDNDTVPPPPPPQDNDTVPPPPPIQPSPVPSADEGDGIDGKSGDNGSESKNDSNEVEKTDESLKDGTLSPPGSPSVKSKSGRSGGKSGGKGKKKKKKNKKKKSAASTATTNGDAAKQDVDKNNTEVVEERVHGDEPAKPKEETDSSPKEDQDLPQSKETEGIDVVSKENTQSNENTQRKESSNHVVTDDESNKGVVSGNGDEGGNENTKSTKKAGTAVPPASKEDLTSTVPTSDNQNASEKTETPVTAAEETKDHQTASAKSKSKGSSESASKPAPAKMSWYDSSDDEDDSSEDGKTQKGGQGPIQPPVSAQKEEEEGKTPPNAGQSDQVDDGEWETVGSRARNTRKKKGNADRSSNAGGKASQQQQPSNGQSSNGDQNNNLRKKKDRDARRRSQNRKSGKDTTSTEKESTEDGPVLSLSKTIDWPRPVSAQTPTGDGDRHGSSSSAVAAKIPVKIPSSDVPSIPSSLNTASSGTTGTSKASGTTMRDILMGKKTDATTVKATDKTTQAAPKAMSYSDRARGGVPGQRATAKKVEAGTKVATAADQNTIPTVPETLSAVSATSAYTPSISNVTPRDPNLFQNIDSSSDGSEAAHKQPDSPPQPTKGPSPSPPLPTLLNPGNNNSSSSSVASSLEVPHTREHGTNSNPSEDDVGFHLLGVCKRLSNDVGVFMKMRDEALAVRRKERQLVLRALEVSLGNIWPGLCSVEMYGSCATNLDLPSSDIDVVVRGLDRQLTHAVEPLPSPSKSEASMPETTTSEANDDGTLRQDEGMPRVNSQPVFSHYGSDAHQFSSHQPHGLVHHGPMMYSHMSLNAERVVRLSMELERQPWAVHVKAIPTATVPVIKILADPTRVPGAPTNAGEDWFLQHAPVGGQPTKTKSSKSAQPSDTATSATQEDSQPSEQTQIPHFSSGDEAPPLWRGADVSNGLLNLDITFEGPEHGGVGSTKFSQKVVGEFVAKSGLSLEETPEVQALMVLKELLAQRRLNEPFSGGLSSYALLLLVVSVLKEREIIKEELDKVERQRRDVASGSGSSTIQPAEAKGKEVPNLQSGSQKAKASGGQKVNTNDQGKEAGATKGTVKPVVENVWKTAAITDPKTKHGSTKASAGKTPTSSWAAIAKNPSDDKRTAPRIPVAAAPAPASAPQPPRRLLKKPSSFADAVSKGMPTAPTLPPSSNAQKAAPATTGTESSATGGQKPKEAKKKSANGTKSPPNGTSAPSPALPSSSSASTKEQKKSEHVRPLDSARSSSSVSTLQERVKELVGEGKKTSGDKGKDRSSKDGKSPSADNTAAAVLPNPDESKFPQGFHDVIEVLCSGETTSGKLLMHFLLFYGQHFDSHATAIDYSGTHVRDPNANLGYSVRSPYMKRQTAGTYDPVTGMLTVDPILVYDPLEGSEANNVARSCFLWSNVRWVFTQSYMTLSSAAETNQGGGSNKDDDDDGTGSAAAKGVTTAARGPTYGHDKSGNVIVDPNSPLLELLLSF